MINVDFLPLDYVRFFDELTNKYLNGYVVKINVDSGSLITDKSNPRVEYLILVLDPWKIYLRFGSDDISLIKRQLPFGYRKLCESCKVFCKLPETCNKYCPTRVRINLPGSTLNTCLSEAFNNVNLTSIYIDGIVRVFLCYSTNMFYITGFPIPPLEYGGATFDGFCYILRNQLEYNLYQYLRFAITGKKVGSVNLNNAEIHKVLSECNSNEEVYLSLSEVPCDYCIYQGSSNCNNCCFSNFKLDKKRNVYVNKRIDREL